MRFSVLLVGVAALFLVAGPGLVSRAVADDIDTCVKGTGDEQIAACTRAINSGRWRGPGLAWAYVNRGAAYFAKGDNDRAIADATKAIELDPKYDAAYYNRGNAYRKKGDY